ncbi:MAG: tetratricopeptide repeat protein [Thermoanaerobaculia bacterium]
MGESDATRGGILSVIGVARKTTGKRVTPDLLFERGESFLKGSGQRLSVMHAEDRRALDALLAEDVTEQFAERLRDTGVASETAVLHLLRAGRERLEPHPHAAATIYDAAAIMGAMLRDSPQELVQSLQAQAYKGRANALRILGRFEEASFCLARARERFIDAAYCPEEAGQVEYTRATILAAIEVWDDALPATRSALRSFTETGNMRWAAKAQLLEAVIIFEQGDIDAAHAKWLGLTKVLAARRDREDLARVWLNLGICETLRKRPADARRWLTRASAAFRELNNPAELARTRWNMGTYLATFEDGQRALRSFASAYRVFLGLRMWLDAGCVALDTLDAMIDFGTPDDDLTFHACSAADTLARADLGGGFATTLETLRKIARHDNRHRVVRMVRAALLDAKASCSEVSFEALGEAG